MGNIENFDPVNLLSNEGIEDITQISSFRPLYFFIFNIVIGLGFAVSLVFLGVAIFNYIQSGNNPENTKKAMNAMIFSVIAMIVVILAWTIKTVLLNTLGFRGLDTSPTLPGGGGGGHIPTI